ncbi:hypothetical protein VaNZ11_015431 [Volvox africanus]|uniref:A-kinase anchor protein 7-like phosphoesterase domain-containing protein n=1 Tax=Volvox africanus TaxID=51714 RepID=A0ABQ5SLX9_9CHLO|nr:hypothetical protein VaNZ11_015431 [Volvox africanus]
MKAQGGCNELLKGPTWGADMPSANPKQDFVSESTRTVEMKDLGNVGHLRGSFNERRQQLQPRRSPAEMKQAQSSGPSGGVFTDTAVARVVAEAETAAVAGRRAAAAVAVVAENALLSMGTGWQGRDKSEVPLDAQPADLEAHQQPRRGMPQVAASLAAAAAGTNTGVDATANGSVVAWRVQGWRSNDTRGQNRGRQGTTTGAAKVAEGAGHGGGRWNRRVPAAPSRPTHFLALRLSHAPSVTGAIERVHQSLRDHHTSLEDHLEPPVKAHLTLMVMALHSGPLSPPPSPVEIVPTLQLLQSPTEEMPSWRLVRCLQLVTQLPGVLQDAALNAPLPLTLRGLGSFGGRVLFLKVADEKDEKIEYQQEGADPAPPGVEDPVAPAVVASTGKPAKPTEALACGRGSSSTNTERGRPGEGGATENAAAETTAGGAASESVLQRLLRLQSVVAAHFEELKYNDEGHSFAPHVTVAKVSYKAPGASPWHGKGGSNRAANKDAGDKRIHTDDNYNYNGYGNTPQKGTRKSGDGTCGTSGSEGHRKTIADQYAGPKRHVALEATVSSAAAAVPAVTEARKGYGYANAGNIGEITVSVAAAAATAAAATPTNSEAVKSITDEYGNRIIDFMTPASAAARTLTPSLQRKRLEQREMENHNLEQKEHGKPLKIIPRQAYEALMDMDAGCVVVDRIQLCSMGDRLPGEYYQVLAEVQLDSKRGGALHGSEAGSGSSECCPDDNRAPDPTEAVSSGLVPHPQLHMGVRMTGAALALLAPRHGSGGSKYGSGCDARWKCK